MSQISYPRLYLSNSNRHRQRSEFLIECDQHTWLHGCYQAIENVVRFSQDYCNAHKTRGDVSTGDSRFKRTFKLLTNNGCVQLSGRKLTHCS